MSVAQPKISNDRVGWFSGKPFFQSNKGRSAHFVISKIQYMKL